jgi:hypothetical protein
MRNSKATGQNWPIRKNWTFAAISVTAICLLGSSIAPASTVGNASQFPATDTFSWSGIAPNNSNLPSPLNEQINDTLSVQISTADTGAFYLTTEGNGWNGNFPAGDVVLWNRDQGPVTFQFSSPVGGMGFYVQNNNHGTFTANFYDAAGELLAQQNGNAANTNDGSTPFIGVFDSTADISTIVLSTGTSELGGPNGDANNFAFDTLEVDAVGLAVPEPASLGCIGILIAGVSLLRRNRNLHVN